MRTRRVAVVLACTLLMICLWNETTAASTIATRIKVCTYNLGEYSYGRGDSISENEEAIIIEESKQFFSMQNCDIIGLQENADRLNTKTTDHEIYNNLYPYSCGLPRWTYIKTKYPIFSSGFSSWHSSGRIYTFCTVSINGVPVYVMSVHFALDFETRQKEYQELLTILSNKDSFIVFGDFNASKGKASEYDGVKNAGYNIANCGNFGAMNTISSGPIDNIITSSNIDIVNSYMPDVYDKMHSDHLPIVAELVINAEVKKCNIRFSNWDGTILQESAVTFGETPVYTGQTPTRATDQKNTYTFKGWSPSIDIAKEDITYTAIYSVNPIIKPEPTNLRDAKICKISDQVYSGKTIKPRITVKYNRNTLREGTDYTVKYKNNKNVGKATVTIIGKGKYSGTKKSTFVINPKSVKISRITAGKRKLNMKWRKGGNIDGYQIVYSLKDDFSNSHKKNIKKAKITSKTIKNLKSGNHYFIRIRTFKRSGGKTYFSRWSNTMVKKVK